MVKYSARIFRFAVFSAIVLEVSNVLLLFRVHGYYGLTTFHVTVCCLVDELKLLVAVRAWNADLLHLLIDLLAVSHTEQQLCNFYMAD